MRYHYTFGIRGLETDKIDAYITKCLDAMSQERGCPVRLVTLAYTTLPGPFEPGNPLSSGDRWPVVTLVVEDMPTPTPDKITP